MLESVPDGSRLEVPMMGAAMGVIMADVAARARVSKATASRALSGRGYVAEETRARVLQAAQDVGFVASPIAASLVTGFTKSVGVLTPFHKRWYFGEVIEGVERELLDNDYDMTLYTMHPDTSDRNRVFDTFLPRKRVDGVIAICIEPDLTERRKLANLSVPIVAIGGDVPDIPSLGIDNVATARRATEHLIGLGHQRIAHIAGDVRIPLDFTVESNRRLGYEFAMEAAGLGEFISIVRAPMTMADGYGVAVELLSKTTRPTAVFAASDELAVGCIIAARRMGIDVPSALSIIGIDGHELAEMFSLTTIEQYPALQGTLAVKKLIQAVSGAHISHSFTEATTRLVVRSSTNRCRNEPARHPH